MGADTVARYRAASAGILLLAMTTVGLRGASAQVAGPAADFGTYATGTVAHVDALQTSTTRVADVEIAFAGAAAESKRKLAQATLNEMQRVVQPSLADKIAYGRGAGLEIGLAVQPSGEAQVIQAGKAEASALPPTDLVTREIAPPAVGPVVWASLLRGQAKAALADDPCETLGGDLSFGLGYAADVQLVDAAANAATPHLDSPVLATDHQNPSRAVSQSLARSLLIPQVTKAGAPVPGATAFGLMSEVRQTIAPITLLKGSTNQITIEVLGEWVLQVVATGLGDGAFVHYGPRNVSPETPILRMINAAGAVTNVLTFQQVFGAQGFTTLTVPGVVEIAIGEDPRAIGGNAASTPVLAANGTSAAAAVDAVRVKLLEQRDGAGNVTARAADLRVGHMEARTRIPAGGISCPLPVTKAAVPPSVTVGNTIVTTITVRNPFECPLESVRLTDLITTEGAARFKVEGSSPAADQTATGENLATGTLAWNDIGPIPANGTKSVIVTIRAQGGGGNIVDTATATGTLRCPPGSGLGSAQVAGQTLANAGAASGSSLVLRVPVVAVLGLQLPQTGPLDVAANAVAFFLIASGLLGRAVAIRQRRR